MYWLLYAQAEGGAPSPFGGMGLFLPLILVFVIMYFFTIRPQQKRDRERREMLDALKKGDQVVTTGGIRGSVVGLTEENVVLKVSEDDNVKIEFVRSAIAQVVPK